MAEYCNNRVINTKKEKLPMRAFILLLGFMCMALSLSCGKTGDLYLPDELSGENGSVGTAQDDGPSSETGSTTGR